MNTNESTTTNESSQCGSKEDEDYDKNVRSKILSASLNFVHSHGWSKKAIAEGAESIGYSGITHGMFENGAVDLVYYFYTTCNQELSETLKKRSLETSPDGTAKKESPGEQVKDAIEIRLKMVVPYKDNWPQAIALMALPPNVPTSLKHLLTVVDDICYYAGDKSTDFTWYTRRAAVAAIYKSTELYMLQDSSMDQVETWRFLSKRVDDAVAINNAISVDLPPLDQTVKRVSELGSAAFNTTRNILGLSLKDKLKDQR